jgi:hypothetical protein
MMQSPNGAKKMTPYRRKFSPKRKEKASAGSGILAERQGLGYQ